MNPHCPVCGATMIASDICPSCTGVGPRRRSWRTQAVRRVSDWARRDSNDQRDEEER